MFDTDFIFINEEFEAEHVSPQELDSLLASGWRHFGTHFYRYNLGLYEFDIRRVIPLRIRLADFSPSKSQRRTLAKNDDLNIRIESITITEESQRLFDLHKTRFRSGAPESIFDFLSESPSNVPVQAMQILVFENDDPLATSYFDVGYNSISGVYATFDPAFSSRRLGIFTLLKEIEFAVARGKEYYYLGYSYSGSSFYDYKKKFRGSESYDWQNRDWKPFRTLEDADAIG